MHTGRSTLQATQPQVQTCHRPPRAPTRPIPFPQVNAMRDNMHNRSHAGTASHQTSPHIIGFYRGDHTIRHTGPVYQIQSADWLTRPKAIHYSVTRSAPQTDPTRPVCRLAEQTESDSLFSHYSPAGVPHHRPTRRSAGSQGKLATRPVRRLADARRRSTNDRPTCRPVLKRKLANQTSPQND